MKREYIPITQDKLMIGLVYNDLNRDCSTKMVFKGIFDNKYVFRLLSNADYILLSKTQCKKMNIPYEYQLVAFETTTLPYYKLQFNNI